MSKSYGYICPVCHEGIKDPEPTRHTPEGLAHERCFHTTDDQIWNDNKLTHGDCLRICEAIGMALGEKHSKDDDARGLAFTVCGGKLTDGQPAEYWLARLNGSPCEDIAIECCLREAVKRVGRWGWKSNL